MIKHPEEEIIELLDKITTLENVLKRKKAALKKIAKLIQNLHVILQETLNEQR